MQPRLWSFKHEIQQKSDNWPQTSSGKKIFHFWQFYLGGWPNRFGKILKVILARRFLWSMVLILSKISSLSLFNFDCIIEISRKKIISTQQIFPSNISFLVLVILSQNRNTCLFEMFSNNCMQSYQKHLLQTIQYKCLYA